MQWGKEFPGNVPALGSAGGAGWDFDPAYFEVMDFSIQWLFR